ncbi:MAG: hypothetical protein HDS55_00055 [Barnesiella sp.]|nr:hypothetical protein [Barnesiella sp.]
MSFFNSIKRMFGFGEDDIEEEIGIDATVTPRSAMVNDVTEDESTEQAVDETTVDLPEETPVNIDGIFEHVLKVFNETLPPFLKESVDAEAQRKFLYDTLDESVKKHLEEVRASMSERMEQVKLQEMTRLRKQLHEAGEKAKKNEETAGERKRQQLSAERQKRALTERIHDLENKINELHAEREQFELENKSLVNRLRVYSVQDEDVNVLREQVISLQEQLKNAAGRPEGDSATQPVEGTVVSDQEMEQLKMKQEMADTMINDLNRTAAELRQQLAAEQDNSAQLSSLVNQAEQTHNDDVDKLSSCQQQIDEMSRNMALLSEELQATQQELAEANENLSMMDEIREQLEKLDEIMGKKNARIKDLQSQNEQLKKRNDSLTDELISLKKTIESNLISQARSESELQREIETLRDELARVPGNRNVIDEGDTLDIPMMADRPRRRGRKSQQPSVKISAIDESLESTDWLVATPPKGTPTLPGISADTEFGYKEPVHKTPPENDAQMSLW